MPNKVFLTIYHVNCISIGYYFSDNNDSSSKTPTIEMYAPNTYNGGYDENLSSISAKSETYSNVSPDYNVSTTDVHQYLLTFRYYSST